MAEFLGFVASVSLLTLIGLLLFVFLEQTGAISEQTGKAVFKSYLTTLEMGGAYLLLGALICQLHKQDVFSAAQIETVFTGEKMMRVYAALQSPVWIGPLSGLFVYAAHALGAVLFGQYTLAGLALAFVMTFASVHLIYPRSRSIWDDHAAREISFLLLCLPGGVFFFLPGWVPLALLITSVLFYILGRFLPKRNVVHAIPQYSLILTFVTLCSAYVLTCAVAGWIG